MSDNSKKIECLFSVQYSKNIHAVTGAHLSVPEGAGLPYALTTLCASVAEVTDCFRVEENIVSVLTWSYFEYVLKKNQLDDLATLTEALTLANRVLGDDPEEGTANATLIAEKLLALMTPTGALADEMNAMPDKLQRGVLTAACVYEYLRHDRQIFANHVNEIDFKAVLMAYHAESKLGAIYCQLVDMVDLTLTHYLKYKKSVTV